MQHEGTRGHEFEPGTSPVDADQSHAFAHHATGGVIKDEANIPDRALKSLEIRNLRKANVEVQVGFARQEGAESIHERLARRGQISDGEPQFLNVGSWPHHGLILRKNGKEPVRENLLGYAGEPWNPE